LKPWKRLESQFIYGLNKLEKFIKTNNFKRVFKRWLLDFKTFCVKLWPIIYKLFEYSCQLFAGKMFDVKNSGKYCIQVYRLLL